MFRIFACLSMVALFAAPALAGEATDAVSFFYQDPGAEYLPENRARFTGPMLDFLNDAGAAWERDEINCISFVFSIDAQDLDLDEITRTLKYDEAVEGERAVVTAHFANFGQSTEIEWTLQHSGAGWQVSDIASLTNDWRVSSMSCD
ncbi:hypothetical protein [Hoeflea sp.]|uniref:hypothetical protein n=1 Tax=Hoeflea sp. TaxID=1940281 RepID=UPI002AFF6BCF|nr:hypothetical protein [Hoeflea sp.]